MESIVRNVSDLENAERRLYESVLGQQLRDNQQVFVMVLNPGVVPDEDTRRQALADAQAIAGEAAQNLQEQGIAPEEADAAVDEALARIRRRPS